MGCKEEEEAAGKSIITATGKNEERENGKSFGTIRFICTDPDATDYSSSDEKSPSSKRIDREIHLNLKKTASKASNPYPGAHLRKSGKWASEIKDSPNKRRIWLGTFKTPEEASKVYLAKKNELAAIKRGMVSSSQKKRNKPLEFFSEEIDTQVKKSPVYNEEIVGAYENWVKNPEEGGMVASHRKRNKPINVFGEEIKTQIKKNPVYCKEMVVAYENWVKTQMSIGAKESERESLASRRKRNKPINVFGEEIKTQIKKNPVYCKEMVLAYENWVKTQMGIGAKESDRESLNESPSSLLPDVYDELVTSESVSYKEIDPQIRKPVYSEELAVASKNLQKTRLGIGCARESGSESVNGSFSWVLDKSTEDVNEEGDNGEGLLMGKVLLASSCEDDNFLLRLGPVIIDNHGSILGEFSWLDDLWICDNEDAN